MDQVNKFKSWLILGQMIVIIILLLLQQCSSPKIIKNDIYTTDTITTVKIVPRPYEVIKFKDHWYPKVDTIERITTKIDSSLCNYRRIYNDSLVDSNLTIYSRIQAIGLVESNGISYVLKTPLKIVETKIVNNLAIQAPKASLYIGMNLSGNQEKFNASPFITLNVKKVGVNVGYGLIDKTYQLGVSYRLFKSRK